MIYKKTRKELKELKASSFHNGDVIEVSKYYIFIKYGKYKKPSLRSYVVNIDTLRTLDCTPGIDVPYYIDDFLSR